MENLEFVNIVNKEIFNIDIPDYESIKDIDMFYTDKSTLIDCTMKMPDKIVEWIKDGKNKDLVNDIETYKQIPYGCIDCTYKTSLKTSIHEKEYRLITNAFRKFNFGSKFLSSNRSKTFFGLEGDYIIFNNYFYNSNNEKDLTPYFIAKIDISRLKYAESKDPSILSVNLLEPENLEFLAITKEGFKCMNTFEVILKNSKKKTIDNDFILYMFHQVEGIVTMYLYFMINLLYYNHCRNNNKVNESKTKEEAAKRSTTANSSGVDKAKENRKRYIYFGGDENEYIYYNKDTTRIGSKGWHIKHSFPVKETSFYNKYGTLVKRKGYMKGVKQGLPPLKTQKIYMDDGKGGEKNGS